MTEALIKHVADIIKERREHMQISQSELGRLSDLHRSYVADLERGERNLAIINLAKIAKAVGLKPHSLLAMAEKRSEAPVPPKSKKRA